MNNEDWYDVMDGSLLKLIPGTDLIYRVIFKDLPWSQLTATNGTIHEVVENECYVGRFPSAVVNLDNNKQFINIDKNSIPFCLYEVISKNHFVIKRDVSFRNAIEDYAIITANGKHGIVVDGSDNIIREIVSLRRITSPASCMLHNSMILSRFKKTKNIEDLLLLLSSTKYFINSLKSV